MRWNRKLLALAIIVSCSAMPFSGAAPEQQLTVYAAHASYSLPVFDRSGQPYIAVLDLLSPMGASSAQLKGKEWKLELNKAEMRLTPDKDKAIIRGRQVDLSGKVLLEDGRLLVPMDSALPLLSRLLNTTVDFHRPSRRIFVGNTLVRFHAEFKNQEQPSLVLNFSQPVKPETNS